MEAFTERECRVVAATSRLHGRAEGAATVGSGVAAIVGAALWGRSARRNAEVRHRRSRAAEALRRSRDPLGGSSGSESE